jgi:cobyric acid synthase CobQ/L-threonine-O-3-phosphate decarboxylase
MNTNSVPNPHGGDPGAVAKALGMTQVPDVRLDFSVNINPLGPPSCVRTTLSRGMDRISQYPPVMAQPAVAALAKAHRIPEDSVVVGNGSTEIFGWIIQALKPRRPGWVVPCYAGYAEVCTTAGIPGHPIQAVHAEANFSISLSEVSKADVDMVFLGSPNNPTGVALDPNSVLDLANDNPSRWIILDESFVDFVSHADDHTLIRESLPKNLIVVKSLTKFFAVPGLRLGMGCANPDTIQRIAKVRLAWSVNALAQSVAEVLYDDQEYVVTSREQVTALREEFSRQLARLPGFVVYPSEANFILVRLPSEWSATRLQAELLGRGILIRSCRNFPGLGENYCRLAVRPHEEIEAFLDVLYPLVSKSGDREKALKCKPPAIMVVGTTSNSGKSVVTAGLCRYFAGKGYAVAPFKAQNMSLNSFVTREGGEMGRAQVVQARAARLDPHTDMNPVLLKPMGESGSQVIVNGQPIGNFQAQAYYKMKSRIRTAVLEAYDRLAKRYDLIFLEGAGSPAEINLQAEDIVNMSMAEYANASVILVADIDRGGVFASIYGTVSLLPEKHRRLLSGVIINKFRGDESLLDSGIRQIEEMTGIPVLGVLPYVKDLRIDDEDSVSLDNRPLEAAAVLDVVVIRLPRISNFTDFLPLEHTRGIQVRYVNEPRDVAKPDLIVIPGTKNTRADLRFLRDAGWAEALTKARKSQVPIFGICGGYQMLGECVTDPSGVEGEKGEERGLCFLPITTVLEREKELAQVAGVTTADCLFAEPGTPFEGYEIHVGRTTATVPIKRPLAIMQRRTERGNEREGAVSEDGLVFGCYVHGLFDNDRLRAQLIAWLCRHKRVAPLDTAPSPDTPADEFDRLSDLLEKHVDMKRIVAWAGKP